MRLIRGEDGKLFQAGIADSQPIPLNKQRIMQAFSKRRQKISTGPEKKLAFALQAFVFYTDGVATFRREKVFHIADILSRSVDFYFPDAKLAIEVDGHSHSEEIQATKDKWIDGIFLEHGILVARFSNSQVLDETHAVVAEIARLVKSRHNWPGRIRAVFDGLIVMARSKESWYEATTQFIVERKKR